MPFFKSWGDYSGPSDQKFSGQEGAGNLSESLTSSPFSLWERASLSEQAPASLSSEASLEIQLLARLMRGCGGIMLLGFVLLLSLSFISWSPQDPSLSHVTERAPENLLGFFGASLSDLFIQLMGLSVLPFLFPLLVWGGRLLQGRKALCRLRSLLLWGGSVILNAGAFALLPKPKTWPLPSGLGGVLGDFVAFIPRVMTVFFPEGVIGMGGIAFFGMTGGVCLLFCLSWIPGTAQEKRAESSQKPQLVSSSSPYLSTRQRLEASEEEDIFFECPGEKEKEHFLLLLWGQVLHAVFLASAFLRNFCRHFLRFWRFLYRRSGKTVQPDIDTTPEKEPSREGTLSHRTGVVSKLRSKLESLRLLALREDDGLEEIYHAVHQVKTSLGETEFPVAPFLSNAPISIFAGGERGDRDAATGRSSAFLFETSLEAREKEEMPQEGVFRGGCSVRVHDTWGMTPRSRDEEDNEEESFEEKEEEGFGKREISENTAAEFLPREGMGKECELKNCTEAGSNEAFEQEEEFRTCLPPSQHAPPSLGDLSPSVSSPSPIRGIVLPFPELSRTSTCGTDSQEVQKPISLPKELPLPRATLSAVCPTPPSSLASEAMPSVPVAPPRILTPSAQIGAQETSGLLAAVYTFPPLDLLARPSQKSGRRSGFGPEELEQNAALLEGVLEDFGVRGKIVHVRPGPVVTLYELEPAPGIKSARVIGLADDIARSMSAISARVAVIPGKNAIGIELPNRKRETVYLRELLEVSDFGESRSQLPLALGKTIGGDAVVADLTRMPHLLVAGTTGSGKSVSINTMILSLLYRLRPDQCKLIMIDPKMLELSIYDGIPHLLTPVVTDPKKAVVALKWAVREMEQRYAKMSRLGVRNIDGFNRRIQEARRRGEPMIRRVQTGFDQENGEAIFEEERLDFDPMPYIVIIVDEMADLMMVAGKDIEGAIQRLAQMARAAGLHLIMATQRPSVDVITGTIKANFPTRISFQVTSKIDSRTILGEMGAEQLLGMGDMLYMAGGGRVQRVHGPFVADDEVEAVVAHLKTQGVPEYLTHITEETEGEAQSFLSGGGGDLATSSAEEEGNLYQQAVEVVLSDRRASTSYVQRRLSIGYNRAASLIERMEKEGLVSSPNHAGKREILVEEGETPFCGQGR